MPSFSDLFIATPDIAHQYDIQHPNYENISLIDITDYEICTLWSCIERAKFNPEQYDLTFVEIDSDAILYQLPESLTEKLALLDEQRIVTSAALWIEFEDIQHKAEVAEQIITDLAIMAQKALSQQKSLFLIFC